MALDPAMLIRPGFVLTVDHCALDVDVPLVRLAAPLVSLAIVARKGENFGPVDCSAPMLVELPREVFDVPVAGTARREASIRVRIEPPLVACEKSYSVGVCLRDRRGGLHPAHQDAEAPNAAQSGMGPASWWPIEVTGEWMTRPRLLTPSGGLAEPEAVERGLQLIGADPTTGARTRVDVRSLAERRGPLVQVRLTTGEWIEIPNGREVWRVEAATWVPASKLVRGDRLFGLDGPVEVRGVKAIKSPFEIVDITDVGPTDTYFLGSVLVRDGRPTSGDPTPLAPDEDPTHHGDVEFAATPWSYECGLNTTLVLRDWPAGATSIALLAERHPGPRGARVALSCDPQREFSRVPRALWDAWRTHPATAGRLLVLAFEAGSPTEEVEAPGYAGLIDCSSDVALLACALGEGGALAPITSTARWGQAGPTCFATGTPIDTPAGPVAIEAIAPGTTVHSFDVMRGEGRVARVLRRVSRGERPILRIRLADGRELRVTGEHPLWLPRAGAFRLARELHVGDRLLARDGAELRIEELSAGGTSEVWELSVDAPDTYFADGILAHNY